MKERMHVQVDQCEGCPMVEMPGAGFYEVVDYLSWQRVVVRYAYVGDHFLVRFPNMSVSAAQELMDLWAGVHDRPATETPATEPSTESTWTEVLVG